MVAYVHCAFKYSTYQFWEESKGGPPPPGPYGTPKKKRGPERVNVLKHSEIKILVNHNKKVTLTTFHVFRLIF